MLDPAFKGVATKVGMTIWRIEVSDSDPKIASAAVP